MDDQWKDHPDPKRPLKKMKKNLAMVWIDYKKAYDMVLKSLIIDYLKTYKISDKVVKFIENTMENYRVKLTAGGKSFTEGKIQRGIFQGDALSPLLFVIEMMSLNHILRKCTGRYKLDKYLDLARELKKLWNMKVMVITFVIGTLGTVTKL